LVDDISHMIVTTVQSTVCLVLLLYSALPRLCFFFQAEDGIRDATVTGVQTCALPICELRVEVSSSRHSFRLPLRLWTALLQARRSEERRVGKECRCLWGRED